MPSSEASSHRIAKPAFWRSAKADRGFSVVDELPDHFVTEVIKIEAQNSEWDQFVSSHPQGDIVQSSAWGVSKLALGQTPFLISVRDRSGHLAGGMQLIQRPLKFGRCLAFVSRGPLVGNNDPRVMRAAMRALMQHAKSQKILGLIVQLPEGSESFRELIGEFGFITGGWSVAPEATARVELLRSEEEILAGFTQTCRRNVRKALKQDFRVEFSSDVDAFYKLYSATGKRKGFKQLPIDYLRANWAALAPKGHAAILLALHGEKPVAGIWLSHFGNTVTFRLPGWDSTLKAPANVNEGLHWAAIRWARSVGAKYYDFGGFDLQSAELILSGAAPPPGFEKTHNFFKRGFSNRPVLLPLPQFLVCNRPLHWLAQYFVPWMRKSGLLKKIAQKLRG